MGHVHKATCSVRVDPSVSIIRGKRAGTRMTKSNCAEVMMRPIVSTGRPSPPSAVDV